MQTSTKTEGRSKLGALLAITVALLATLSCGDSAVEPAVSPTAPPGLFSTLPTDEAPMVGVQPPTIELNTPDPTLAPQPTPTPNPTYTPVPTQTLLPTPTPDPTSNLEPTDTPTPDPTTTPAPTPTATPNPTQTAAPTATPNPTPAVSPKDTPTWRRKMAEWKSIEWFETGCVDNTLPTIPPGMLSRIVKEKGRLEVTDYPFVTDTYPTNEWELTGDEDPPYEDWGPSFILLSDLSRNGGYLPDKLLEFGLHCLWAGGENVEIRLVCSGDPPESGLGRVVECIGGDMIPIRMGANLVYTGTTSGHLEGQYHPEFRCKNALRPCIDGFVVGYRFVPLYNITR